MKARLTLKVLTAALLLASCAQTQNKPAALNIRPFQEVQHSYEQAKAQYELGRYYHGQLRYRQAIEAYRQALAMNPDMVEALNAMGAAYAESGDLALARQQFEEALKLQPQSVYTYNNLGYVNYLAGDYQAAVDAYKQALRLDASHEKTRQNLVLAYDKMGHGEQIARTEAAEATVAVQPPEKKEIQKEAQAAETQTAWVRVSPVVYEMHSTVAPAERPVATPTTRMADTASVARPPVTVEVAPVAHSASVEPAAPPRVAMTPPAPSAKSPVVAPVAGTKPSAVAAVVKVAPPVAAAVPKKVQAARGAIPLHGVEVSNGNGIRGMAARVARYFSSQGILQARLTNQKPFAERRSRIEYRPGSAAEAARINKLLPKAAPQIASHNLRPGIRVRLVLGHDLQRDMVAWGSQSETGMITAGLTGMELPNL